MHLNPHDSSETFTVLRICHVCGKRLLAERSREVYAESGREIGEALLCAGCANEAVGIISSFVEAPQIVSPKGVILLAEDDKDMQTLLHTFLSKEGYTVCCVDNGYAFMAEALLGCYDLILSDICMPKGYGDEVLPIIRKRGVTTPVIFITGFAQKSLILDSAILFEKPVELAVLLKTVEEKIKMSKEEVASNE